MKAHRTVAPFFIPAKELVAKVRHPREGGDPCVRHTRASGTESAADRICVSLGGHRAEGAWPSARLRAQSAQTSARPASTWIPAFEAVVKARDGVQEPPCTSFPRKRESGIGSEANRVRSPGFQGVSATAEIRNPTTVDPVPDPRVRGDDGAFTTASFAGMTFGLAEPPSFAFYDGLVHGTDILLSISRERRRFLEEL